MEKKIRITRWGPSTARLDTVIIPQWIETEEGRWYAEDVQVGLKGTEVLEDGRLRVGAITYRRVPTHQFDEPPAPR